MNIKKLKMIEKEKDIKSAKERRANKIMKRRGGITLIALVITIVILVIMSTISINYLFGENGLVTKAQQAAQLTEEARAKEEMGIYLAGIKGKEAQEEDFRLSDYLSSNIGNEGLEDYLNNGDGYGQVAYNGHKFLVNLEDYTFTYLGKSNGTVNRRIEQVLGNNNESVPGISMVEAGAIETEDLGWRVLSVNEDGSVNLIANRNTGFEVSLSGINGYTNGVKALNEICSKLYGGLEINGEKVISARSVNLEDFYNITYTVDKEYTTEKIQPKINQLDVANNGYSTDQIDGYIDAGNTSGSQASNSEMLVKGTEMIIKVDARTEKETVSIITTGNNYWLATRDTFSSYILNEGAEEIREVYGLNFIRTDGGGAGYTTNTLFQVEGNNTTGANLTSNCAIRPVITVPGSCVPNKTVGTVVETDPFYKGKTGDEAKGYVKADSIADLLGVDVKGITVVNSGLPTIESDMTWSKLIDGGYNSLTGEFDTEKYDYYIADRTTKLQMRLTGAPGYNNGVLAMDTVMNNIYGNLTEIKLSNGTTKEVNVVLARNVKFEDFYEETGASGAYGEIWSTNAEDSTAQGEITSTNRYAPTLFAYEDIDPSNGISDGYSDAKITTYNLSKTGTKTYLTDEQRSLYSYEYYNENPGLKIIYNYITGRPNRNISQSSTGTAYWFSSRCVYAVWNNIYFNFKFMNDRGETSCASNFVSDLSIGIYSYGLRPVLQVSK